MSDSATVRVELSEGPYDIRIGTGTLDRVGVWLTELCPTKHAVIVTDENVQPYAERVAESLAVQNCRVDLFTIEPGEMSKSVDAAAALWNAMLSAGTDRKSAVVAVGGGVVGDLTGWVAASYARGLSFFQVPTTLLAQVDSSVGGKTGINLADAKNMVGAFWQPIAVAIDTLSLDTLPDREFTAGLAEVIKYGVIQDAEFFAFLETHIDEILAKDQQTLTHVIARCCQLKAEVVQADERETTGLRAILNYGHTFAHAIEAATEYGQWLHGEAVAIGMECAARLARSLGRIDDEMVARQTGLIAALRLPREVPDVDHDRLIELMSHDKKVEHGKLRFVLPDRLGHVELVSDVEESLVRQALCE